MHKDTFFAQFSITADRKRHPLIKTCCFCGAGDLRWGNVKGGKWRLFTKGGNLHSCSSYTNDDPSREIPF